MNNFVIADQSLINTASEYKSELLKIMLKNNYKLYPITIEEAHLNHSLIGIGYGAKITKGKITETIALRVYIQKKLAKKRLSLAQRIPTKINGLPTDVIEASEVIVTNRCAGGASIGHFDVRSGTLGCLVKRTDSDKCFILSNNHVLADVNRAFIGDSILEPSRSDGGNPKFPIAELTEFEPISFSEPNIMDAAIAQVFDTNDVLPEISSIGKIQSPTVLARLFQPVCKYGRTTSYTTGIITDLCADINVRYGHKYAYFTNQIAVNALDEKFADHGDSGAVIVDVSEHRAVGLLFAVVSNITFANPIDLVLARFKAEIV